MDSPKLDNINIEQHKELFEYEMTEVILNLRGTFATVINKSVPQSVGIIDSGKLAPAPIPMLKINQTTQELPKIAQLPSITINRLMPLAQSRPSFPVHLIDLVHQPRIIPKLQLPDSLNTSLSVHPQVLANFDRFEKCATSLPAIAVAPYASMQTLKRLSVIPKGICKDITFSNAQMTETFQQKVRVIARYTHIHHPSAIDTANMPKPFCAKQISIPPLPKFDLSEAVNNVSISPVYELSTLPYKLTPLPLYRINLINVDYVNNVHLSTNVGSIAIMQTKLISLIRNGARTNVSLKPVCPDGSMKRNLPVLPNRIKVNPTLYTVPKLSFQMHTKYPDIPQNQIIISAIANPCCLPAVKLPTVSINKNTLNLQQAIELTLPNIKTPEPGNIMKEIELLKKTIKPNIGLNT